MAADRHWKVIIVGAGIGGLTAAATLRRVGMEVEVFERAGELRPAGGALSLMSNAVLALRTLGIEPKFEEKSEVLSELHFVTTQGRPIRTMRFKEISEELGAPCYGIHRTDLQQVLLAEIGDTPIHLDAEATGFERDGAGVRVRFKNGTEARGDILVGADGFSSAIRGQITGPELPRDADYVCWLSTPYYQDPRIPKAYGAHFWGRGARFGIANIGLGRIYWWGTKNLPAEQARTWHGSKQEIVRTYAGWADVIRDLIEATPDEEILSVPAQDRPFIESWGSGPVTLLGDAAHPMLTSLGQGAAVAMEDAVVLARQLADAADPVSGLRAYEDRRRERTRRMVKMSRSMSRMEQAEGAIPVLLRNTYFRLLPQAAIDRQNRSTLDFNAIAR
jgi:2-polyprenyl-6-methoxyphenol hydroxylase-like FAD-dependent oxidoreductase